MNPFFLKVNLQSFDSLDGDDERNSVQPSDVENQGQLGEQDNRHLERRSTLNSIMRKWTYWQPKVWSTLEEPNSSKAAQVGFTLDCLSFISEVFNSLDVEMKNLNDGFCDN